VAESAHWHGGENEERKFSCYQWCAQDGSFDF